MILQTLFLRTDTTRNAVFLSMCYTKEDIKALYSDSRHKYYDVEKSNARALLTVSS